MAGMSMWSVAVWAMLPALAVSVLAAMRGTVATRMVALQLASAVTSVVLVLTSFAFDQSSYTSMAVALALLNVVGTLVVAVSVERWL